VIKCLGRPDIEVFFRFGDGINELHIELRDSYFVAVREV